MRRAFASAVVALAVAGGLGLFAAGRTWGTVTTRGALGARQHVAVSGRDVSSGLAAVAIALLALTIAVVAGRGWMRRLAGGLAALCGVALVVVAVRARSSVDTTLARHVFAFGRTTVGGSRPPWWIASVIAGVIAVVAGAVIAVRGGTWTSMGARYEAPVAQPVPRNDDADAWDALDRGDDPTAGP